MAVWNVYISWTMAPQDVPVILFLSLSLFFFRFSSASFLLSCFVDLCSAQPSWVIRIYLERTDRLSTDDSDLTFHISYPSIGMDAGCTCTHWTLFSSLFNASNRDEMNSSLIRYPRIIIFCCCCCFLRGWNLSFKTQWWYVFIQRFENKLCFEVVVFFLVGKRAVGKWFVWKMAKQAVHLKMEAFQNSPIICIFIFF